MVNGRGNMEAEMERSSRKSRKRKRGKKRKTKGDSWRKHDVISQVYLNESLEL